MQTENHKIIWISTSWNIEGESIEFSALYGNYQMTVFRLEQDQWCFKVFYNKNEIQTSLNGIESSREYAMGRAEGTIFLHRKINSEKEILFFQSALNTL